MCVCRLDITDGGRSPEGNNYALPGLNFISHKIPNDQQIFIGYVT